ncbi:MAG: response regulator, partial [Myxococcales bacterium]|nr:response regulator [Myxococcales bacterium]
MEPRTALLRELTGGLVASLRAEVARVMETPSEAGREALARRIHGLAGRASRMELSLLADELSTCHAIATAIDEELGLEDGLRRDLEEGLERVAQFAQNELARAQGRPAPERRRQSKKPRMGTSRVALFAPETTVDSLLAEDCASEDESAMLAAERLTLTKTSHHDMRRKKPDVIVVDGDLDLASRFVEQLMLHNDTDGIPVIVLGTWDQAEDAAGFIALGAARTLPKPVSPSALRAACHDVGPEPGGGFEPLGECTLDALGARLAAELHRGLCDAAEDDVRRRRVDLGDGAEVLTVMWEAIGRMRELVTAKTGGRLRFERVPALDALPRAPWLRGSRRQQAADRAATQHEVREPGVVAEAALAGATIVIAEDDLSTNWFLSGVLREAGAEVHSVYDGRKALDHAYLHTPDLIISDVVMPDLDGFTLCRAVKRDVLLRSAPVVLLSWKADLLQRVRELGAGADGYLLKEASGEELLQRVMEVLRPRRAIARRLAQGGEVRGRLDGLTPYALLKLVARERPNARITLRDANHLYEVEMRSGRPVLATRTRTDGTSERGRGVMAAIVGVGAGRFGVEELDTGSAFTAELDGSLDEQLLEPIARMRAAQGLVSGQSLMRVGRVQFDEARLALPLAATPEPSRGLMRALAAGASPRDLVGAGRASAELIEGVLSDAARHHAVSAILTPRGLDMLPAAVDRELAVLSGEADEQAVRMSYAFLTGALPAAPAFEDDDPPLADLSEVSESAPVEASTAPEDEASWDDEELDAEEADHDEPR